MSDTFTNDKIDGQPNQRQRNMSESPGLSDMGGGGDSQQNEPAEEMPAAKNKGNYVSSVIEKFLVCTLADKAYVEPCFPRAYKIEPNTFSTTAAAHMPPIVCVCTNPENCVTLKSILDLYRSAISEEQAWALIFQFVAVYHKNATSRKLYVFDDSEIPNDLEHVNIHRDGSVHCTCSIAEQQGQEQKSPPQPVEIGQGDGSQAMVAASHKKVLCNLAVIVYSALDYDLPEDEEYPLSKNLERLFDYMTAEDEDDKDFNFVLQTCRDHIKPTDCVPEYHYKSVCRALAAAPIELRAFVKVIVKGDADNLYMKAAASENPRQDVLNPGFSEWARLWMQVVQELRGGVTLKKSNFVRTPIEFQLTPYEALMENIRSKRCTLRAVMVNGVVPLRRQKSAHALLMESIRSRPPLKKAVERQLPPLVPRRVNFHGAIKNVPTAAAP